MWPGAEESRTIHDVGFSFKQGRQQRLVVARVIFQVCILNDDEVAGGFLDPAAQSSALAHILRLQKNFDLRELTLKVSEYFARPIRRAIVNAEQFDLERHPKHTLHDRSQRGP